MGHDHLINWPKTPFSNLATWLKPLSCYLQGLVRVPNNTSTCSPSNHNKKTTKNQTTHNFSSSCSKLREIKQSFSPPSSFAEQEGWEEDDDEAALHPKQGKAKHLPMFLSFASSLLLPIFFTFLCAFFSPSYFIFKFLLGFQRVVGLLDCWSEVRALNIYYQLKMNNN